MKKNIAEFLDKELALYFLEPGCYLHHLGETLPTDTGDNVRILWFNTRTEELEILELSDFRKCKYYGFLTWLSGEDDDEHKACIIGDGGIPEELRKFFSIFN